MLSQPLTFFHFTDLHIRSREADAAAGFSTFDKMMRIVETARALEARASFSIITGDLSDQGHPESYERLKEIITELETFAGPVLVTPGNHDHRSNYYQYLLNVAAQADQRHNYSRSFGGLKVVVLDSKSGDAVDGGLTDEQFAWLESELKPNEPTLLAFHHPLPPLRHGPADRSLMQPADARRLLDIISGYRILAMLTGHVHSIHTNIMRGVPCISGIGTSFMSDHQHGEICFYEVSGFNIGTFHEDTLTIKSVLMPSSHRELARIPLDRALGMTNQ